MVKVESADATVEKVTSLGGRASPAFDIGDQGRMSVCFDPTGAELDVWEPRSLLGTDTTARHQGSRFEAMTPDVDRAASYNAALVGWTTEATPSRGGGRYTSFALDGVPVAGMMPITPRMGALRPRAWVTYFTVRDAAEAARQAVDLGGTISRQLHEAAGGRRLCGITSPQGVPFCVAEYAR